eukprot:TCONS_00015622-protein
MRFLNTIFVSLLVVTIATGLVDASNIEFCEGTGYQCSRHAQCWPGGWRIDDIVTGPKCLCKYGWVGNNAVYDNNPLSSKMNLIRADGCSVACHYTPYVRNTQCASEGLPTTTATTTTPTTTTQPPLNTQANTPLTQKPVIVTPVGNNNPNNPLTCTALGLECTRCDDLCGVGGWCVLNTDFLPRCLCDYGFTGSQSVYITGATGYTTLSLNRVRAFDCKTKCFYSPYVRNPRCASEMTTTTP